MKTLGCLLSLIGSAVCQDVRGTIIVLVGTQQKIVIAADSRKIIADRGGKSRSTDSDCKISALANNLVFASAGRRGHFSAGNPQFTWDAYDIAQQVANGVKPANGLIRSAADTWAGQAIAMHNMDSRRGVIDPVSAGKEVIESAFFAGIENAHPIAYQVDIVKALSTAGTPQTYSYRISEPLALEPFRFHPIGLTDISLEFGARTPRARDWMETFQRDHDGQSWDAMLPEFAEGIVSLTARFSSERSSVGGSTDIIEITAKRIRWVRSKPGC